MDGRGVRLLGRELDLPETAATVRVRGGETLVTDGPFAETKEFIAGFDILECAEDRKSTRLNSSHGYISYAVFCLKKKKHNLAHCPVDTPNKITEISHSPPHKQP